MDKTIFNMWLGVVVAVFVAAWVYSGTIKARYNSPADNNPQSLQERIRPVGDAVATGSAAAAQPAPVAQAPAPAAQEPAPVDTAPEPVVAQTAPADTGSSLGKETYDTACFACHTTGVAGSPKVGDVEAWAPRIAKGMDTLNSNAINGFQGSAGMMPPKGGRMDLSDEAIIAAVEYMVEESQ